MMKKAEKEREFLRISKVNKDKFDILKKKYGSYNNVLTALLNNFEKSCNDKTKLSISYQGKADGGVITVSPENYKKVVALGDTLDKLNDNVTALLDLFEKCNVMCI